MLDTTHYQSTRDRAIGTLVGLAAGDRIGGPIRMALRVAESLLARHGFEVADVAARYVEWWREGAFDTGPTAARVLELVETGVTFERASQLVDQQSKGMTAGCNPAHRIAPLAMCASISDEHLATAAREEAALTHQHPLAGDAAAAVARLCRALIQGVRWREALTWAAIGRSRETHSALLERDEFPSARGGFAPQVLGAAIYFVETSTTFGEALSDAIQFAGPSNYCPVLVGSIGGARWGFSAIEAAAYGHHHELKPRIVAVAESLALGWD